uniref:SFRICE_027918 n=1 Tax=Spodoptera frugiperda TaxID=7108 RepID=A0A2H1WMA4_SPOFR
MLSAYSRNSLTRNSTSFKPFIKFMVAARQSPRRVSRNAAHEYEPLVCLKLVEFLVKQLREAALGLLWAPAYGGPKVYK